MAILADKFFGAQFNAIADATGFAAAILICEQFGGQEQIFIPKSPDAEHSFRDVVGDKKFTCLTEAFGGTKICIPKSPRISPKKAMIIDDLIHTNERNSEIAHRHKVTERYVRQIRSVLVDAGVLTRRTVTAAKYLVGEDNG